MSKAFTSDESSTPVPLVQRAAPTLAPGEVRYVTAEGHAALVAERERLQREWAEARASGAIDAAARRVELEQKLSVLEQTLAQLTVFHPEPAQQGRVFFSAWVTLEDDDGKRTRYRIVGPDEVDPRAGLVSVDSPLARQLLGKEEGDTIELERPAGPKELTIVEVRYPPAG